MPPSTTSAAPVMNGASSGARNKAAFAALQRARQPIRMCTMRRARRSGRDREELLEQRRLDRPRTERVGTDALARTPARLASSRQARRPCSPCAAICAVAAPISDEGRHVHDCATARPSIAGMPANTPATRLRGLRPSRVARSPAACRLHRRRRGKMRALLKARSVFRTYRRGGEPWPGNSLHSATLARTGNGLAPRTNCGHRLRCRPARRRR